MYGSRMLQDFGICSMGMMSSLGSRWQPRRRTGVRHQYWHQSAVGGQFPCRKKVREGGQGDLGSMWRLECLHEPQVVHTSLSSKWLLRYLSTWLDRSAAIKKAPSCSSLLHTTIRSKISLMPLASLRTIFLPHCANSTSL